MLKISGFKASFIFLILIYIYTLFVHRLQHKQGAENEESAQ